MKEFCPNCKKAFDKAALVEYEKQRNNFVDSKVNLKIGKVESNPNGVELRRVVPPSSNINATGPNTRITIEPGPLTEERRLNIPTVPTPNGSHVPRPSFGQLANNVQRQSLVDVPQHETENSILPGANIRTFSNTSNGLLSSAISPGNGPRTRPTNNVQELQLPQQIFNGSDSQTSLLLDRRGSKTPTPRSKTSKTPMKRITGQSGALRSSAFLGQSSTQLQQTPQNNLQQENVKDGPEDIVLD